MSLPLPFKELTKRLANMERLLNEHEERLAQMNAILEACKRKKPGPKAKDAE